MGQVALSPASGSKENCCLFAVHTSALPETWCQLHSGVDSVPYPGQIQLVNDPSAFWQLFLMYPTQLMNEIAHPLKQVVLYKKKF